MDAWIRQRTNTINNALTEISVYTGNICSDIQGAWTSAPSLKIVFYELMLVSDKGPNFKINLQQGILKNGAFFKGLSEISLKRVTFQQ